MNDIRWIIAMWLIELAISIAPKDESKRALLSAISPWAKINADIAALHLANRKAGKQ